ncbi:MAG: Multidrug export protein MepA [Pseudomonadota bacterium]|jgi:Na+-driven multidrug efflux pump
MLNTPLLPTLLRFALPNMAAMLATALAAIAETGFVGSMGVSALAGMALVFPFVMLQQMLSAGAMGGGVSSAISRALGAGDTARANALAVHALWIGLAAGLAGTALMLALGPVLYALLGGRGEALAQALAYSNVAFLGCAGMWVVNTLSSVIRGSGNMRIPSITLLALAVTQVLVGGACGLGWFGLPKGGMAGVALGQVVANLGGALFLFSYLRRKRGAKGATIHLAFSQTPVQATLLKDILRVGAVACLSPLQTVLTILVLTHLVARFGTEALAGYGIGARLEFLLVPIAFAVGVASVPLVGMAIGAGLVARARKAAWLAAGVTFTGLTLLGLVVALVPDSWSGLFTEDAAVLASAATYFHWVGPGYGLFGLGLCLYFSSLGAGQAIGPVLAGTLRLVVIAVGGWYLAEAQAATWTIYALAGFGMAAYGLTMVGIVYFARWGKK